MHAYAANTCAAMFLLLPKSRGPVSSMKVLTTEKCVSGSVEIFVEEILRVFSVLDGGDGKKIAIITPQ